MPRAPVALLAILLVPAIVQAKAIPVKVEKGPDGYRLTRGGAPYFIKGAGGRSYLETLKATGGNSIRTWGEEDIEPLLDRAQELGLTVTVGIWLGQPRQGFRYDNEAAVRSEVERSRQVLPSVQGSPGRPGLGDRQRDGGVGRRRQDLEDCE